MSTRRQAVASEGWLNVIESVFSGMARAIIHNSDYRTVEDAQTAIVRYIDEHNSAFRENPRMAWPVYLGKGADGE
jgi:hypothetical protein